MNYSHNPASVRVDFFKEHGKWYLTEAVIWLPDQYNGVSIHDAFRTVLLRHLTSTEGKIRLSGMWAVCLEPHHEHSHPLMMLVPEKSA